MTRSRAFARLCVGLLLVGACGGEPEVTASSAGERAARRAYDGAPPVVAHEDFRIACGNCHDEAGMPVRGVGLAPASPHDGTVRASATQRCRQCHVFRVSDDVFVPNGFVGLPQDLRPGARLNPLAPPTVPHRIFMRENCLACHAGPAARAEIATSHPDRDRCRQCHVPVTTRTGFTSTFGRAPGGG